MSERPDLSTLLASNPANRQAIDGKLVEINADAAQIDAINRVVVASEFALRFLQRNPDRIDSLLHLHRFELDSDIIEFDPDARIDLDQVRRQLRLYRQRKMVEIIFLDVARDAAVESVLRNLSDLADQLIDIALQVAMQQLAHKHGQPLNDRGEAMHLNIIAMGKLGGRELNFSSDVDLICCYEADGELDGYGQLTYQEFFSRVVRLFTQLLSDTTAEGFVYRVDLRLRPWGDSGPVVLSHAALEHYYQLHGREWEQYAMVKARVLSGSAPERTAIQAMLKPFVYRKYHDYRVFEGLASLKDKIDAQARSREMRVNIKIGPGGIREIEFFVQAFQILKGGRNHQLQRSEIFVCFEALRGQKIVEPETIQQLREAYCFLRRVENRLQMYEDHQTHDLPDDPLIQQRIAATMDFADWAALLQQLQGHRDLVNRCFTELFKREARSAPELVIDQGFDEVSGDSRQWEFIEASGLEEWQDINRQFNEFLRSKAWGYMSARAKQRFNTLLPELLVSIGPSMQQATLFRRLMRLFASIAGRSVYFELLFNNPALLQKLVSLFDRSAWIAAEVSQYPMLLENLIQGVDEKSFDKNALVERLRMQLANVEGDTELELDTLRLFKREQTLVIASAELAQEIDAIEVGHYLTDLAEVVLEAVYQLASTTLQRRHGVPRYTLDGKPHRAELAIVGYGKLGGRELHYQSDLDLIFLHDSQGESQLTDGDRSIENSMYFARLAQKIISMTSVLTASGKLYEIDSRLRPEGSSGLLVSSIQAYRRYQLEKAWTWEHQALVRARVVAGDPSLQTAFASIRAEILCLERDPRQLAQDIVEMRERIYRNNRPPESDRRDLKHSRGGMVDIEFMVQYWVLGLANSIGPDHLYSDNISLLNALFRLDLITRSQSQLVEIYQTYHRLLHESVLQGETAEVDADAIEEQVEHVINCWNECFGTREN